MTAPPVFPTLPGLGWPLSKAPDFSSGSFTSASGIRIRQIRRPSPLWTFTLTYEGLTSDAGADAALGGLQFLSLQTLMGQFLDNFGSVGAMLLLDPSDSTISGQVIGVGDGSSTNFVITRTLGTVLAEPVGWVNPGDVLSVTVGGAAISGSSYTITEPNILALTSAPESGAPVAISVAKFYFQVTFPDELEFEEIMQSIWQLKELKLRSIVPNYPTLVLSA